MKQSNYHLFDMTRGSAGSLTKKGGNYIGKLRATNSDRSEYVLLSASAEREEIAGISFDRFGLLSQLSDGSRPRAMKMLVPSLDADNVPKPHRVKGRGDGADDAFDSTYSNKGSSKSKGKETDNPSLVDLLHLYITSMHFKPSEACHVYCTKVPVLENGNYRLNFHGRVCRPSVKNFQMVEFDGDLTDIVCQFGKVDEDLFHLDYKAPLNAAQAFALALCQFNL